MGIDTEVGTFLTEAHQSGISFRRTLTIGRQFLLMSRRGLERIAGERAARTIGREPFAEKFFQTALEAEVVDSIDATAYEGATIIHDMNTPLPSRYSCAFDAVVDGGSLEHIFNVPVALGNSMRATRVGGSLFCITVANNFLGHGLYQFSPELFFRTLAPAYGFQIQRLIIVEYSGPNIEFARPGAWHNVADPLALHSRVTLVNSRPTLMMVQAHKVAHVETLFEPPPQQSDYAAAWEQGEGQRGRRVDSLSRWIAGLPALRPLVVAAYNRYKLRASHSLANRTFFRPVARQGRRRGNPKL